MARVAAGICCVFALGGLDVGIATRHWLSNSELHSGLVQSQADHATHWNTSFLHGSSTTELAFVASGIVTFVLGALAGVLLALALGTSSATSRRCARAAQLLAVSAAATAVAFIYLYPVHMQLSWSAFAFAGGLVATLIGATAARASASDEPIHSLA